MVGKFNSRVASRMRQATPRVAQNDKTIHAANFKTSTLTTYGQGIHIIDNTVIKVKGISLLT